MHGIKLDKPWTKKWGIKIKIKDYALIIKFTYIWGPLLLTIGDNPVVGLSLLLEAGTTISPVCTARNGIP